MTDKRKGASSELIGEVPVLYSIFKGQVVSIQPYGAFIKIPGCSKNGLIHKSQLSNTSVERPEDVIEVGEKVYCKVISAEPDGSKIALSMKLANQTTGKDLDPTQVQTSLDEKQRKSFFKGGLQKIELGAVYDTTCRKCGGKGHLAQDCFHRPGDQTYELVKEESVKPCTDEVQSDPKKRKHKKKHKKQKKKKRSEGHDNSPDSAEEHLGERKHHRSSLDADRTVSELTNDRCRASERTEVSSTLHYSKSSSNQSSSLSPSRKKRRSSYSGASLDSTDNESHSKKSR